MTEGEKKALFANALLVAHADGALDPRERTLLAAFIDAAQISPAQAKKWLAELQGGAIEFKKVAGHEAAVQTLKLAVGIVAADGALDPRERLALYDLAKAVGVAADELRTIYAETWGKDALADIFGPRPAVRAPAAGVVVVTDGFTTLERLVAASPELTIDRVTVQEALALSPAPGWILFHALDERPASLKLLSALRRAAPAARVVPVVARQQAAQISYLLEAGAHRCVVEPIYPKELATLLAASD